VVSTGAGYLATWIEETNIVSCSLDGVSSPSKAAVVEPSSAAMDYELFAADDGRVALMWEDMAGDGEGADPVILYYDPLFQAWSAPVTLLKADGPERDISPVFSTNGVVSVAYCSVDLPIGTNGFPIYSNQIVNLYVVDAGLGSDPAVVSNSLFFATDVVPGSNIAIVCEVANLGETAVTNLEVAFYDGDPTGSGYMVAEPVVVSNTVAGGCSVVVTQQWAVPHSRLQRDLWVVVDPYRAQVDRDRGNNVAHTRLFAMDLAVEHVYSTHVSAAERIVGARVANLGALAWTQAASADFYREDGSNLVLLASVPLPEQLTASGRYDASFRWDVSTFRTNSHELVRVVLGPTNAMVHDADPGNDSRTLKVATLLDTDGDGLVDADEYHYGADPTKNDTDGDGLSDGDEVHLYFTGPHDEDTDRDGMTDGDEIAAGTDPLSASDVFAVQALDREAAAYRLSWEGKRGRTYRVLYSDDLFLWHDAPDGVVSVEAEGVVTYRMTEGFSTCRKRYFRVVSPAD